MLRVAAFLLLTKPSSSPPMLAYLKHFLHGFGIGVANVIPGVSGGTMALIFGIYERVIGVANDGVQSGVSLVRGDWPAFVDGVKALQWPFLAPLVIGILAAPFLGAELLSNLLETHPALMRSLFFGLIVGSLPIPWVRIGKRTPLTLVLVLVAGGLAWLLSSLPTRATPDPEAWMIFGAASLAISAMVLPGVSGAYLLLVFGMYEATLSALGSLDLGFIALFGAGAAVGLAGFTVLLNWLLKNRHDATMAVLVGLMIGSLRALWPWLDASMDPRLPVPGDAIGAAIALAVLGLAVTGGLSWWELRRKAQ
ncbi:MAG: putative membrane protein [Rhodothermales bacterium]|jgi:putative membrane protein